MRLKELTREAVDRYLSTVLLVDERWQVPEDRVGRARTPGLRRGEPSETGLAMEPPYGGDLDVVEMTNAFIKHGMLLAPVRPEPKPKTRFAQEIRRVAHGSDVVVLDWNIYDDDGTRCVHLAKELLKQGKAERLRVLVIYTGQQPAKVEAKLKSALELPEFTAGRTSRDHLHVMVLLKPGTTTTTENGDRQATALDVPQRILDFVADSMYGILPTVALSALAAIRDNSQKLLGAFEAGLDPGYLGHRALLGSPDDAADQLPAIVADELRAIIEQPQVSLPGRYESVSSWIENPPDGLGFPKDPEMLTRVHRVGNPYVRPGPWTGAKPQPKSAYFSKPALALQHAPDLEPNEADERWSFLLSVSTDYSPGAPNLRLGTIVVERSDIGDVFWLCLMPLCDSVRLTAPTMFPLLRLQIDNDRFNCVVTDQGSWVRLRVPTRVDQVEMAEFEPTGEVVAADQRQFLSTTKRCYEWVAALKPDVAHRFAQSVGERIARIGLDESEWLRRWAR